MPPGATTGGSMEIFFDRQAGEYSAFLRAIADPGLRSRATPCAISSRPQTLSTFAPAQDSDDRPQRRRLAGAVAPKQRNHLAAPTLRSDAVQDMRLAVVGMQVAHLQDGPVAIIAGPQVGLDDLRIARDVFVVALGQDLAAAQDRDDVAESATTLMLCSTIRIVRLAEMRRISS